MTTLFLLMSPSSSVKLYNSGNHKAFKSIFETPDDSEEISFEEELFDTV